jgi:glycerol uptake facilitator-like aquaporin
MMVTRNIGPIKGIIYIIAQYVGSIVGALILWALTPEIARNPLGANRLNPGKRTPLFIPSLETTL